MTQAYPLHWPMGFERTKGPSGKPFRQTVNTAASNLSDSLRLFGRDTGKGVTNLMVSSNVTLMEAEPRDPGVAVYFRWDGIDCCIAVDRYATPAQNLQAIVHVIEAERTKMRHGGLNIVRAAFRGYAALPPPKGADGQLAPPWWQALGLPEGANLEAAEAAFRRVAKEHHPDRGGDPAKFNLAVEAIRQARQSALQ